jgi:hypothetical protein
MKKGRTAGIFILMMAVLGFFLVSHAADKKKNQTKFLTSKTVTPSKTKVKGKKPLKFKPDLVVEDISLDKGFITFTLKNNGPGYLSDDDHKQGEVKVSYKGRVSKDTYPFSKVDPKRKLKKPDGSVTYKTKEKLTSRQEVTVSVYFGKKTLKPDKKISLKRTLGKKRATLVQKPEMVPKHRDDGIRVFRPREGDVFHRGGSISINYRFSWDDVAAEGDIYFRLISEDENVGSVLIQPLSAPHYHTDLPLGEYNEVLIEVHESFPYGEYHIFAIHFDSGAEGESDVFSIQGIGEGSASDISQHIRLLSPKGGDHLSLESMLVVRWKYYGPLEDFPRGWRVEGRRPGEEAPTFTSTFRCQRPTDEPAAFVLGYPTRTCSELVGDIPDGDYILRIIGGSFSAETEGTFHAGVDEYWPHIELFNPTPGSGDVVFKGDNIQVKFSVRPDDAPVVLRIKKGEVTVYSDNVNPSSSSGCGDAEFDSRLCEKTIPINDSFETGRDYKVVVSSRHHSEARMERGIFSILDRPP